MHLRRDPADAIHDETIAPPRPLEVEFVVSINHNHRRFFVFQSADRFDMSK
jgi:hypothetical protein